MTFLFAVTVGVTVALSPLAARAQPGPLSLTARVGAARALGDLATRAHWGFGVDAGVEHAFTPRLAAYLDGGTTQFPGASVGLSGLTGFYGAALGLKATTRPADRVSHWVRGGMLARRSTKGAGEAPAEFGGSAEARTGLGGEIGAGVRIRTGAEDAFTVGIDYRIHGGPMRGGSTPRVSYVSIGIGTAYTIYRTPGPSR